MIPVSGDRYHHVQQCKGAQVRKFTSSPVAMCVLVQQQPKLNVTVRSNPDAKSPLSRSLPQQYGVRVQGRAYSVPVWCIVQDLDSG